VNVPLDKVFVHQVPKIRININNGSKVTAV